MLPFEGGAKKSQLTLRDVHIANQKVEREESQ